MKHLRILLYVLLFVLVTPAIAEDKEPSVEFKVKAVCLFNFAKYVQWPESVFSSDKDPIRVCIVGDNPFGNVFQSSDAPKEAQNRPLQVLNLGTTFAEKDISSCQILYWGEKGESLVKPFVQALKDHKILTVADTDSKVSLISFTIEDGRVRFRIRHKEADSLQINISSQLLKLALTAD